MKHIFTLVFLLCCSPLFAQSSKNSLLGNWVKAKVEYIDGEELSDEAEIKHSYQRYSFEKPNKAFYASAYDSKGMAFTYNVTNNLLQLQNSYGHLVNSFLIEKQTKDELVLLQKGQTGFESPDCIRYYYIDEGKYQSSIPLTSSDILAVNGTDTLYAASPKVYASFKANDDFHDFLTANMPAFSNYTSSDNFFLASFIVRKTGELDSLQILESIGPTFDKQFVKAFNKSKGKWQPATLAGASL